MGWAEIGDEKILFILIQTTIMDNGSCGYHVPGN